jgi:hypothetical protein
LDGQRLLLTRRELDLAGHVGEPLRPDDDRVLTGIDGELDCRHHGLSIARDDGSRRARHVDAEHRDLRLDSRERRFDERSDLGSRPIALRVGVEGPRLFEPRPRRRDLAVSLRARHELEESPRGRVEREAPLELRARGAPVASVAQLLTVCVELLGASGVTGLRVRRGRHEGEREEEWPGK